MSQDSINGLLVLKTGNRPDSTSAPAADLYVNVENAFQALGPGHSSMTLGGCADFRIGNRLDTYSALGWRDEPAPAMIRNEDAMVTGLGVPVILTPGFGTSAARRAMYRQSRSRLFRACPSQLTPA